MKFLIVDDSKIARRMVSGYVNTLCHEVAGEASDGLEAIEKYKELLPDIVTIDLEMPNMKGIEASEILFGLNPNLHIILITSIVDKKEIHAAQNIGIKKILTKPFSLDELKKAIEELAGDVA